MLQTLAFFPSHVTLATLATEKAIESGLSEEIKYLSQVSTVHPHEGSIYGAEKVT